MLSIEELTANLDLEAPSKWQNTLTGVYKSNPNLNFLFEFVFWIHQNSLGFIRLHSVQKRSILSTSPCLNHCQTFAFAIIVNTIIEMHTQTNRYKKNQHARLCISPIQLPQIIRMMQLLSIAVNIKCSRKLTVCWIILRYITA